MKVINIVWNEQYSLYLKTFCKTELFPMATDEEVNIYEHDGIWHIETMEYGINIDSRFIEKIEVTL